MSFLSLKELRFVLHPTSSRYRVTAVLVAYVDESGTHAQSPVVMVGGFVGPESLWANFEPDWNEVLSNLKVPYFHASECEAGNGIYQSLSRPLRESLFDGLARVIAKHKPVAITTAVMRWHWEETKARGIEIFDDPYHSCFEFCLQHLSKWAKFNYPDELISLVFERQTQFELGATSIFDLYNRNDHWGKEFYSLTFSSPQNVVALQAADLIVYEKTKHELARLKNPDALHRPVINILSDADVRVIDYPYDGEILKELLTEQASVSSGK